MITHRAGRLPLIAPCTFVLLLSACIAPAGRVTTATPITFPTPTATPLFAPTNDARAYTTVTVTPIGYVAPTGGAIPPLLPPAVPCPTAIGATLAAAGQETTPVATEATGRRAPILTVPPPAICGGATGPPTATAIAGRLPPPPPLPTPRPNPPPTTGAVTGPATTFIPTPPVSPGGTGPIPPTASATPGPPTRIPTATRVGVPPHRQFVSTTVDSTPGVPALPTVATTTTPGKPAYTADEVRAYVLRNPPHGNKITTSAAPGYTVVAVTLVTADQFDQRFGTGTQVPPETLVYMVELAGQFTMSGGPAPGTVNTYPSYIEVFDAHTGRLLIEGGFTR